jgi:hypothetical protein
VGPASYFIDLHLLENRFQFERHLRSLPRGEAAGAPAAGRTEDQEQTGDRR